VGSLRCVNRLSCRFITSKELKNCLIQSPGAIERANPEGVKHMDVLNKPDFPSLRLVKPNRLLERRRFSACLDHVVKFPQVFE
jgi:hypothetical protein